MSLESRLQDRFKIALVSEVVSVVAGGLLVFLLARLLSPGDYGLLFLAIAILSSSRLLSVFGIPRSAGKYITEYEEKDPGQIPHILRSALGLNLVTILIVSGSILLGSGFIASAVGETELRPLLVVGSLLIVANTLFVFIRWILQAFEEIKVASAYKAVNQSLRLIFAAGFVLIGGSAFGALVGYILAFAVTTIFGMYYLYTRIYLQYTPTSPELGLRKRIAKYSIPIAANQSAHLLDHHLDRILVGFFAGPIAVAYYTLGKQVIQFVGTPVTALGFTLSPAYGSQKAQGNRETAAKIYETSLSKGLLFYFPAAAGLMLLAEPLVLIIFESGYAGAVPVLQIMAVLALLQSVSKLTSHGLDYLGRARARAVIKGITAVMNVFLNVILIPFYGAPGAAGATVFTFFIYVAANVYIMHLELGLRLRWLTKQATYAIAITAAMSAVVFVLADFITGVLTLTLVALVGVLIWGMLVLLAGLISIEEIRQVI